MLNNEVEPLVMAFKREVAKMRDRDATDLEIQAMLEFVEQTIRWREEMENREPLGQRLEGGSGPFPSLEINEATALFYAVITV